MKIDYALAKLYINRVNNIFKLRTLFNILAPY